VVRTRAITKAPLIRNTSRKPVKSAPEVGLDIDTALLKSSVFQHASIVVWVSETRLRRSSSCIEQSKNRFRIKDNCRRCGSIQKLRSTHNLTNRYTYEMVMVNRTESQVGGLYGKLDGKADEFDDGGKRKSVKPKAKVHCQASAKSCSHGFGDRDCAWRGQINDKIKK